MSRDKERVLSTKDTVKALKGRFVINEEDGMAMGILPGKWTAASRGHYFTVRPTGVVRSHQPEKDDLPYFVKELGLEKPERFSDKLVKETNRHAVFISATPNKQKEAFFGNSPYVTRPEDFHYMADQTMHPLDSVVHGSVDRLEIDGSLIAPSDEKSDGWSIKIESIVLLDYHLPLCDNELIWTQEMNKGKTYIGADLTDCGGGHYEPLVFKRVEVVAKPGLSLKPGEEVSAKKHFTEKVSYPIIAQVSYKSETAKYVDTEAKVDNDILKYVSGCQASDYYAPQSWEQVYIPGPRICY